MDQLDELTNTLRPWLTRWEHLLTMCLPATQYAAFDVNPLLKMDPKSRNEVYQIRRTIGASTVNEIRGEDDQPPLVGGDEPIPLPVLERMLATTRTIPNSYMSQVVLEADRIGKLLEHMADIGLTNPMAENVAPINKSAESYLGGLITQVRSGPLFGDPDGKVEDSDRKSAVTMLQTHEKLGHLTPNEAAARLAKVGDAKTLGELAALFKDLPHMADGVAPSAPRPAGRALFGPAEFRASDEDRNRARALLAIHAKAGRLRGAENDERSRKAAEAVTCGDLDMLFADLPVVEQAATPPEEDRSGEPDLPLFGPAALALLHSRAMEYEPAAPQAALNGRAH
jgi:hypothetical protein